MLTQIYETDFRWESGNILLKANHCLWLVSGWLNVFNANDD